ELLAEHRVEAPEHALPANEHRHVRAQCAEYTAKLHRDVAAADDGDPLRALLELEEIVGRETELGAGQRGHDRVAAGRDHDALGRNPPALHVERVRIDETRVPAHERDAVAVEVAGIDFVQAVDVSIAALLQHAPVVPVHAQVEAVVGGVREAVRVQGGVPHDLFGHAADVHAGAAEAPRFDDDGIRAVARRALRVREPAAAAADHDEIEADGHSPRLRGIALSVEPRGACVTIFGTLDWLNIDSHQLTRSMSNPLRD